MGRAGQPTIEQIRAVFRILGDLRDLRGDPGGQHAHMVERLCRLLGARQGTALRFDGFRGRGGMKLAGAAHAGWANPVAVSAWEQILRSGQFDKDVLLMRARRIEAKRPRGAGAIALLRPEIMPDDEFLAGPLAREWLPVLGIDSHLCGWYTPADGGSTLAIALHREYGAKRFDRREREILHLFLSEHAQLGADGKLGSPGVADGPFVVGHVTGARPAAAPALSPRERQVLRHLLKGHSVKQTAAALGLSHRTIEDYIKSLYRKYRVHSRAELLGRFVAEDKG